MRRFPGSWTTTLTQLGFRRKRRGRKDYYRRQSRIEPLEERRLLSLSNLEPDYDPSLTALTQAPQQFRVGDFTLTTDDWSGKALGGDVQRNAFGLGVNSGVVGSDSARFDPGESWSFRFDRPGMLMGIRFDEFTIADADRAVLIVGSNEPIEIVAKRVKDGFWRPKGPLHFNAGDTLELKAVAPTAEDFEAALEKRLAQQESDLESKSDSPPKSVWRVTGLQVIGEEDSTLGGYLDLARKQYASIPGLPAPRMPEEDQFLATSAFVGVDIDVKRFYVSPAGIGKLRVNYYLSSTITESFSINIHRSFDGIELSSDALMPPFVVTNTNNQWTAGDRYIDIPVSFADVDEDYYLVAHADVEDDNDLNDKEVFEGGLFSNQGTLHFHGAQGTYADEFNVVADSASYGDEGYGRIFLDGNEIYLHDEAWNFPEVHIRTHGSNDTIAVRDVDYLGLQIWAFGGDGIDTIYGGHQNDLLFGNGGGDTIYGQGGDDVIWGDDASGSVGGDYLLGGAGDDEIYGGEMADWIAGGSEDDVIHGGDEGYGDGAIPDELGYGGYYDGYGDYIEGSTGSDEIYGGWGRDTIHGQSGNDLIHGGQYSDYIAGGAGDDNIWGDEGTDEIHGGDDSDTIDGGADEDFVTGDDGDDTLRSGGGIETLDGGTGNDTYQITNTSDATITIADSGGTNDKFDFSAWDADAANGAGAQVIVDYSHPSRPQTVTKPGNDHLVQVYTPTGVHIETATGTGEGFNHTFVLPDEPIIVTSHADSSLWQPLHAQFNLDALTLREAIAANAYRPGHDTVEFAPSLFENGPATIKLAYDGPDEGTVPDQLSVNAVTIEGRGSKLLFIDGDTRNRVFSVGLGATATLRGLTVKGGRNVDFGAGIYNAGNLTLDSVRVTDNRTRGDINNWNDHGGGIYSDGGTLRVFNSTIDSNEAHFNAGIVFFGDADDALEIRNSVIHDNIARYDGGYGNTAD